jgi:maleylacetoacetate isomerase
MTSAGMAPRKGSGRIKLYTFFRSGTSHRLRIALNLKGLRYEQVAVDLRREQHLTAQYKAINPQQLVPALDVDGLLLTQSPAIIEWLEERYPQPPFVTQRAGQLGNAVDTATNRIDSSIDRALIHHVFQSLVVRSIKQVTK